LSLPDEDESDVEVADAEVVELVVLDEAADVDVGRVTEPVSNANVLSPGLSVAVDAMIGLNGADAVSICLALRAPGERERESVSGIPELYQIHPTER
jgi:hypothetical protein